MDSSVRSSPALNVRSSLKRPMTYRHAKRRDFVTLRGGVMTRLRGRTPIFRRVGNWRLKCIFYQRMLGLSLPRYVRKLTRKGNCLI